MTVNWNRDFYQDVYTIFKSVRYAHFGYWTIVNDTYPNEVVKKGKSDAKRAKTR